MLRVGKYLIIAAVCLCFVVSQAQARDLKASLPINPPLVESKDKGILVDLVKAMAEEYKDGKITWEAWPPARAMDNVEKGRADFEMPQLVPPNASPDKLPFMFSTEKIFRVVFVLYTNKNNKDINPANVNKYKIDILQGMEGLFDFKATSSPDLGSSLQKVDLGRIDGFIFAMPEGDAVLKKLGLKNIKRWEYKKYDAKMVLNKSAQGKEVDKILTDIIGKLKANGKYQKVMGPILDQKFDPWQP